LRAALERVVRGKSHSAREARLAGRSMCFATRRQPDLCADGGVCRSLLVVRLKKGLDVAKLGHRMDEFTSPLRRCSKCGRQSALQSSLLSLNCPLWLRDYVFVMIARRHGDQTSHSICEGHALVLALKKLGYRVRSSMRQSVHRKSHNHTSGFPCGSPLLINVCCREPLNLL
jgi:hypothetical protein